MGVYIKGLQMPKSCSTCQMLEGDLADGICHAAGRWLDDDEYWTWYVYPEGDIDDSRPSNCPLIELPDHPEEGEIDKWWERSETVNAERSEDGEA